MENFDIRSADGTRLKAYRWSPETEPKADILLVHGGFEHLGRYEHVAQFFVAEGTTASSVSTSVDTAIQKGSVDT